MQLDYVILSIITIIITQRSYHEFQFPATCQQKAWKMLKKKVFHLQTTDQQTPGTCFSSWNQEENTLLQYFGKVDSFKVRHMEFYEYTEVDWINKCTKDVENFTFVQIP